MHCNVHVKCIATYMFNVLQGTFSIYCNVHIGCIATCILDVLQGTCWMYCKAHVLQDMYCRTYMDVFAAFQTQECTCKQHMHAAYHLEAPCQASIGCAAAEGFSPTSPCAIGLASWPYGPIASKNMLLWRKIRNQTSF